MNHENQTPFKVYAKVDNKLAQWDVLAEDHQDAINIVKEVEGVTSTTLVLIHAG